MLSTAERQRRLREKRKAAGFRLLAEWVHEEDRGELEAFAKGLRRRRFAILEEGGGLVSPESEGGAWRRK